MLDRFRLGRESVKEKGIATAVKAAVIIVILIVAGVGVYFMLKGPEGGEKGGEEEQPSGFEWFQTGNTLSITQLQTKQSGELENNRIGGLCGGGWSPAGELFDFPAILDDITSLGLKLFRFSLTTMDWEFVIWGTPEFSIHPVHDDFITGLANNGVKVTYILLFKDEEALGREGRTYPRFKTEEEIQRYLDYVQFIVHHFKDRVQYFEIWNEPNIEHCLQWIEVDDYINLVKRAVPVIRQEYSKAKIVVGSTPLRDSESRDYLFSILRSDVMPLVDVVSWHPMYATSPEFDSEYYYEYPSIVQEIKNMASAHGFKGEYETDELFWWTEPESEALEWGV